MDIKSNSQEPYRQGRDSYNYGCMDQIDDFFSYAERYKKSGDILIEWVENQKGLADCVIQPLCFLYLQYLELTLKSIIVDGHQILGNSEKLDFTHDIPKLWDACKVVINRIYNNEFSNAISEIDHKIQTFLSIAPSHDAFRYPILKNKIPSFPQQHYVNVRVLGEEIHDIWKFFFGISNDMAQRMKQNRKGNVPNIS